MRHIILSEDGIHPVEDAYHRLMSVCFFPESPRDQAQAHFIAWLEKDEFLRVPEGEYRPSEIFQATAQMIENRTAQLFGVGLVALAFIVLKANGYRPSLNRASIVASYSACEFGAITWRSGLDPTGKEKVKPVTGDAATLARLFRRYRSVAHICAARVSASGYLEHLHIWDQPPEVVGAMIQTSASIQVTLEETTDVSSWNLWDVKTYFPAELGHAPVLVPENGLLHWIQQGLEMAILGGKIVNKDGGEVDRPQG